MLQPKKTKFRKAQKGRMKGLSGRGHQLSNGMFGIKSLDSVFITSRQILNLFESIDYLNRVLDYRR